MSYRVRKFMRIHRGPVIGTFAVTMVLIFGMVGTMWGLLRAEAKETDRVKAQAEIERQQNVEEQRRMRNRDAASA